MNKLKKYGKIILFDTLAVFCFIGVILFGWLPGPGGIPLLLIGIALLAVNHDWAESWLESVKHKGISYKKYLFPDKKWLRHTYDLLSVVFTIIGIFLIRENNNRLVDAIGALLIYGSIFLFVFNRDRIDKFSNFFKRKKA